MNKNMKYGLAALIVIALAYGIFFSGPRNYEDCVLANMKTANSDRAASIIRATCRAKFPLPPNIFDQFDNQPPSGN